LKRIQRKLLETRQLAIELFLNEAKIAGRLMHPNIVQVLDVGEVQGALYLAMEYVHGRDLRNVIKKLQQNRTVMPLGEACHIVREVAQALHHAYWSTDMTGQRLSVVHRDVSPHNVVLSYDGAVKLLDFGVAMSAVTEHAETMIVGKWLYMSPETTMNDHIDHRSDLFSLGVILYLLCCGYMPFAGAEPKEIVRKIRGGQYTPLQELVAVPERLALLVARLLAPNPDDRPQRGQEVATELTEIARQYGIESSGANIATMLKHLFPDEAGTSPSDTQGSSIREMGSFTTKDRSPASLTPSSQSLSGRALAPVDVSETYRPRTGSIGIPGMPDLRPPTAPTAPAMPPVRSTPVPAPAPPAPVPLAPVASPPWPASGPHASRSELVAPPYVPPAPEPPPRTWKARLAVISLMVVVTVAAAVAAYLFGTS
ncbi:MAG TPA: serine/threonine-protein kinase, partial [Kofleriaceae bacterium]|nr:serine/threonine-protein kinase [Kofleriaceae bacterium]